MTNYFSTKNLKIAFIVYLALQLLQHLIPYSYELLDYDFDLIFVLDKISYVVEAIVLLCLGVNYKKIFNSTAALIGVVFLICGKIFWFLSLTELFQPVYKTMSPAILFSIVLIAFSIIPSALFYLTIKLPKLAKIPPLVAVVLSNLYTILYQSVFVGSDIESPFFTLGTIFNYAEMALYAVAIFFTVKAIQNRIKPLFQKSDLPI